MPLPLIKYPLCTDALDRFVSGGETYAYGIIKMIMKKGRDTVNPHTAIRECGFENVLEEELKSEVGGYLDGAERGIRPKKTT